MGHGSRATAAAGGAMPTRNERRSILGIVIHGCPPSYALGGGMNCRAHLLEGAASADIGDRVVDVGIGRLRLFLQQRRDRHDHATLAVAALRYVEIDPSFLNLGSTLFSARPSMVVIFLPTASPAVHAARTRRRAVDVHGAGAALRDSAAVFGPGHADRFRG